MLKMEEAKRDGDPLIGTTLGGLYRVERLLGIGGMGRVYQATHTHLGKAFAVKVLAEGRADKPDAAERFLREARAATKIEHEHIVEVVNCDRDPAGRLFIVMELLRGESLADRLERGPLPLEEAIEIATQTAHALEAAHEAGIVHRDLKPENIFLTQRNGKDFVKILDFGISKIKNPDHGDLKLTATDQIVGTPLYISPELARGVPTVDHRTDIYALGAILYEMITGTPPFTGQNQFQLLYKHGNEPPQPPSQRIKARIPAHVEAAVLRALEKNPADRFDSMRELSAALEGPTVPRRARTVGIPLLFAAIAAGVAFVLWPTEGRAPAPPPAASPEAEVDSLPAPAPPPVTAESEYPAESSEPAPATKQVKVKLDSNPRGAWVVLNGQRRGKTPLELELDQGAEATARFSLRGYRTEERRFVAEDDEALWVRLKPRSRPKPPPIKTDF
jgi:serine/threonine protein kinase